MELGFENSKYMFMLDLKSYYGIMIICFFSLVTMELMDCYYGIIISKFSYNILTLKMPRVWWWNCLCYGYR